MNLSALELKKHNKNNSIATETACFCHNVWWFRVWFEKQIDLHVCFVLYSMSADCQDTNKPDSSASDKTNTQ